MIINSFRLIKKRTFILKIFFCLKSLNYFLLKNLCLSQTFSVLTKFWYPSPVRKNYFLHHDIYVVSFACLLSLIAFAMYNCLFVIYNSFFSIRFVRSSNKNEWTHEQLNFVSVVILPFSADRSQECTSLL